MYNSANLQAAITGGITSVETVVAIVIVGLGVMWGVRKLIKTVNCS